VIRPPERSRTVNDFKDVVELRAGEIDVHTLRAPDVPRSRIANTVFVQNNTGERAVGPPTRWPLREDHSLLQVPRFRVMSELCCAASEKENSRWR